MSLSSLGASTHRRRVSGLERVGITFSSVVGLGFGVLICITPWAYGGVEGWYRATISGVLGILLVVAVIASLFMAPARRFRDVLLVMSPLLALAGIGALQWSGGLYPLDDAGNWNAGTIYPGATELAIAGLLAAIAAAFLGATIFSRDTMFVVLVVTCMAAAVAVAFLGIGMRLSGDDRTIRGVAVVGTPFAKFVNRNNAAAFLLVGISCGIALLTSLLRERRRPESLGSQLARRMGIDRGTLLIVSLTLTAILLAGIVASASRGGTISAVVAVLTGVGLLGAFGKWRWAFSIVPILGLALALAMWLGLSERTVSRFQSLTWHQIFSTGRVPHWLDAMHSVQARPVFGSGLGTYGYAYQEHSQRETLGWFQHADNEYVELAVESGAAGIACLLAGLLILAWAIARGGNRPAERTLIACLLAGELTHAIFDYGIAIPATVLPAAALTAAAATRLLASGEFSLFPERQWSGRVVLAGTGLLLAASLGWASQTQSDAWAVDQLRVDSKLAGGGNEIDLAALDRRITELAAALKHRPDDAEGHRLLAELYVSRYRTTLAAQLLESSPSLGRKEAWRATSMPSLHRAISRIADATILPNVIRMRQDALSQRDLIPALTHYKAAAAACPWLPDIRVAMQALVFLDPKRDLRDTEEIAIAARLFPADPALMRTMARMAWSSHNHSLAGECWGNAFAVSAEGFAQSLALVSEELGPSEAVALVWPERTNVPGALTVEALGVKEKAARVAVGERLRALGDNKGGSGEKRITDAYGSWLLGNEEAAAQKIQRILAESPLEIDLRMNFAQLLWSSGDAKMAIAELRQAIWLGSDPYGAQELLSKWISHEQGERASSATVRMNSE